MFEIFAELMAGAGLRIADVSRGTGISYSIFTDWKAGRSTPKLDKLQRIADFFDVSVEYLTTGHEDPARVSREEQRLLGLFRQLNRAGRDMLFAQADLLAGSPAYVRGDGKSSSLAG